MQKKKVGSSNIAIDLPVEKENQISFRIQKKKVNTCAGTT